MVLQNQIIRTHSHGASQIGLSPSPDNPPHTHSFNPFKPALLQSCTSAPSHPFLPIQSYRVDTKSASQGGLTVNAERGTEWKRPLRALWRGWRGDGHAALTRNRLPRALWLSTRQRDEQKTTLPGRYRRDSSTESMPRRHEIGLRAQSGCQRGKGYGEKTAAHGTAEGVAGCRACRVDTKSASQGGLAVNAAKGADAEQAFNAEQPPGHHRLSAASFDIRFRAWGRRALQEGDFGEVCAQNRKIMAEKSKKRPKNRPYTGVKCIFYFSATLIARKWISSLTLGT